MKKLLLPFLFVLQCLFAFSQQIELFNNDWEFIKDIDTSFTNNVLLTNNQVTWTKVSLPHTANIEPVEKINQQWQGTCFYRKAFFIPAASKGKHIAIQFDAAMHEADVYVNGMHIYKHVGGYLPFYIDLTNTVNYGKSNSIIIKLNNEDNGLIPPGKPIRDLDFNFYSGVYRNAWLITKNKLHITNSVAANRKAAGGVTVHYENVSGDAATLVVQTEVANDAGIQKQYQIKYTLIDKTGKTIASSQSKKQTIDANAVELTLQNLQVANPLLWSPNVPHLYDLYVEVWENGKAVDKEVIRTGIKSIRIDASSFYLNGSKLSLRGTNRHQEYPYVGYAMSDNAQYRDAYKIKKAGFNFVRCSHYPPSPAFLDACDEIGILVMDAIPGWQFFGNDSFQQNSFQNVRDMVRRDRNHPSIILWEASLNESGMDKRYMETAHAIVHEELPFQGTYTAGWMDNVYDVFIPARQHAKAPDYWKKFDHHKPLFIGEYGDWEYYAQNAGFNQTAFQDLKVEERTSRQLRAFGGRRLLQQAINFQEAHNDDLYNPAIGDANWLMFDYKRGYADDIESSGIMDIFRLPKFAFYFYQSQLDPVINKQTAFNKPMIFIASYWQDVLDTVVKIYSNCSEVELFLNGKSQGRQMPDKDLQSTNLKHPPFTFHLSSYSEGTLTAVGYINQKKAAEHMVKTPDAAASIQLRIDESGKPLQAGKNDFVFVYATISDKQKNIIPGANNDVVFTITGDASVVGPNTVKAEAGIATILLKAGAKASVIKISAASNGLANGSTTINVR
jgi:beta-galactosidase